MKKLLHYMSIILLFINGIAACFGGTSLIMDPSGEKIGLSLSRLRFLPFKNYLVPGVLLFVFVGMSSLIIAILMIRKTKFAPTLLIIQGIVLGCWILVQALSIPSSMLQLVFGGIAIIFIVNGIALSSAALRFGKPLVNHAR
jgi:hypothetical protein